jgi:hypothetical protein
VSNAPRNYYDAVRRLQRAELFEHQESEDDSGPAGIEEILQALPEAYAAQRSEMTKEVGA